MSEQIKAKLTTEITVTGTVEEVERFKYALECLSKDPTEIDDTLQISAALLDVVQDYVLLLNKSDRGIYQVALKTVEVEPVVRTLVWIKYLTEKDETPDVLILTRGGGETPISIPAPGQKAKPSNTD